MMGLHRKRVFYSGYLPVLFFVLCFGACSTQRDQGTRAQDKVASPEDIPSLALITDRELFETQTEEKGSYVSSMVIASSGEIISVVSPSGAIKRYDSDFQSLGEISRPDPTWIPFLVQITPDDILYLASGSSVQRFELKTNQWDQQFTTALPKMQKVYAIASDVTGDLWVLRDNPDRTDKTRPKQVLHVTEEGVILNQWSVPSVAALANRMTCAPDGTILITETSSIWWFSRSGSLLRTISQPNRLAKSGEPPSIAVDSRNFLYAAHPDMHTFDVYGVTGELLLRWKHSVFRDGPINAPKGVFLDQKGRMFLTHRKNHVSVFSVGYEPRRIPLAQQGIVPEGPSVLLVTLDTTRLDHLGIGGYERPTSPNIDALAHDGVWFPNAVSCSADTTACHATMLTSLQPFCHETRNGGFYLRPEFTSLAEMFDEVGYHTAAFTSAFTLVPEITWIDQGFHLYVPCNYIEDGVRYQESGKRLAEHTNRLVFKWLDTMKGKKFFLWVHYFDPHSKYLPPEGFLGRFQYDRNDERLNIQAKTFWADAPVGEYIDRYDEEILYMDHHVGELLRYLEQNDFTKDLFIALLADHGEVLYEDKVSAFKHGHTLLDVEFRIPLIVRDYTGRFISKPEVSDWCAEQIDIAPTLAEVAGLQRPAVFQGTSLLQVLAGNAKPRPFSWSQVMRYDLRDKSRRYCIRKGSLKFSADTARAGGTMHELSANDLSERTKLILSPQQLAARLNVNLDGVPAQLQKGTNLLFLHSVYPGLEELMAFNELSPSGIYERLREIYGAAIVWDPNTLPIDTGRDNTLTLDEERLEELRGLGYVGD